MHNFSLSGGQLSVVKRLLEIPDVLNDMQSVNNKGQMGLDIAIEEGHTEVAEAIRAAKRLRYQGESEATEVSISFVPLSKMRLRRGRAYPTKITVPFVFPVQKTRYIFQV